MSKLQIKNVRASFLNIFTRPVIDGKEGKFGGTFLIPKDNTAVKKKIDKAIEDLLAESKTKVSKSKYCIKDGDEIFEEKEWDGYEDHWALKASNQKRPTIIDRDKTPLAEDDANAPYSGCYVNIIVDFWVQDNQYGKRVNGNLYGVQFVKDGEAFGSGNVDVTDEFDDLDDDEL